MDPEFASNLRERVSAGISSPDGLFLEFIAEGSTFFFPHDTSWPDLRRAICVSGKPVQPHFYEIGRPNAIERPAQTFEHVLAEAVAHARYRGAVATGTVAINREDEAAGHR